MFKYYESHITIEPLFGEDLENFASLCRTELFKPAKLLMQKDRASTATRSDKDTFCTGHSKNFGDIETRMRNLITKIQKNNFKVWRYKIEAILVDERLV